MEYVRSIEEIKRLENNDTKLRAILGAISTCGRYFTCTQEIYCTAPIIKENIDEVVEFINENNLSISDFATLSRSYVGNYIERYNDLSPYFLKLQNVLQPYLKDTKCYNPHIYKEYSKIGEQELEDLIIKNCDLENSNLKTFLKKYKLSTVDFIIISKTYYNCNFFYTCGNDFNMFKDLINLLEENNISKSVIREKYIVQNNNEKTLTKNNKKRFFNIFGKH